MTRLYKSFAALDPYDKSGQRTWQIGLEQRQLEDLLKYGDHRRLAGLLLAAEVTSDPIVIFEDWKRPEHEDGLCYCGIPIHDFRAPGITVPAPPDMVFCVYVKPSGKMSRWNWEPSDADNPSYPEAWDKDRFGSILWPNQQTI